MQRHPSEMAGSAGRELIEINEADEASGFNGTCAAQRCKPPTVAGDRRERRREQHSKQAGLEPGRKHDRVDRGDAAEAPATWWIGPVAQAQQAVIHLVAHTWLAGAAMNARMVQAFIAETPLEPASTVEDELCWSFVEARSTRGEATTLRSELAGKTYEAWAAWSSAIGGSTHAATRGLRTAASESQAGRW